MPSGRSVSARSLRSWNVYISFETTSEVSPAVRANRLVSSNDGRHDLAEARALERLDRRVDHVLAQRDARRQPVERARGRSMCSLIGSAARNGFVARSRAIVVSGRGRGAPASRAGGSRRACAACDRAPPDRSPRCRCVRHSLRKQHISGEQHVLDEVRDVRRRVSGNGQNAHRERPDQQLLAALEGHVRRGRKPVCLAQPACILGRSVAAATGSHSTDVVDVAVRDQNGARLELSRRNLTQDPLRLSPGIHHEHGGLGGSRK